MVLDPVAHPGPSVGPVRHLIGKAWLKAFGWEIEGRAPDVAHGVFVAAPHTSNWDLPFTLAIAWSLRIHVSWVGKDALFKPPFGRLMRVLGGVPVDRSKSTGFVAKTAQTIRASERMYLLIAPSGTRSHRAHWKGGFYWIAKEADVPLLLGFLDYGKKRGGIRAVLHPSGDLRADMERIREAYRGVVGRRPERTAEPRLAEESGSSDVPLADAAE